MDIASRALSINIYKNKIQISKGYSGCQDTAGIWGSFTPGVWPRGTLYDPGVNMLNGRDVFLACFVDLVEMASRARAVMWH